MPRLTLVAHGYDDVFGRNASDGRTRVVVHADA
jgi:hypothetical protein